MRDLPIGPSRHLVRFVVVDGRLLALKEEPLEVARHEHEILREIERRGLPAVRAIGIAEHLERDMAVVVTAYLPHSLQYRRLFMRVPLRPGGYRDRLLDAMASLLVDLHRAGIYWGDCSLANTLFRRDGDAIAAHLVDAETSEAHPSLSDGQRAADLGVLVENVAFGLADLAAARGRPDLMDEQITAAEAVRSRYENLWAELHHVIEIAPSERHAVTAQIRRLNDLGFAVREVDLLPGQNGRVQLRVAVGRRDFHARELKRLTGITAMEGQARLLINDQCCHHAWLDWKERRTLSAEEAAARWLADVFEPTVARLAPALADGRDPVQAYCDLLEHKWLLSERAGRDVGMETAITSYLAAGAPAPERGSAEPALDDEEALEEPAS
jgi:hypothetical protein